MHHREDIVIGRTLKRMRLESGLSQSQLARALHSTKSFVSRTESGKRAIKVTEAILYAVGLGVTPSELNDAVLQALAEASELQEGLAVDAERNGPVAKPDSEASSSRDGAPSP